MRYLVTARVKPGKEAELFRAIESGVDSAISPRAKGLADDPRAERPAR
jgi:hypothetical protein